MGESERALGTVAPGVSVKDRLRQAMSMPAVQRRGAGVVPTEQVQAATWLLDVAARTLCEFAHCTMRLSTPVRGESDEQASFVARLRINDRPLAVGLNQSGVQAVLAATYARRAGLLVRPELITGVDRGTLEYCAMLIAEALQRAGAESGISVTITGFEGEQAMPGEAVGLYLRLNALEGMAWVAAAGQVSADLVKLSLRRPGKAPTELQSPMARCGLALRPIVLSEAELRAAEPGDVIDLGTTQLGALGGGATLMTAEGWTLGDAVVEVEEPHVLRVRVPQVDPRGHEGFVLWRPGTLVPVIGHSEINWTAIERGIESELVVELARSSAGDVRLVEPGGDWGAGELVRLGDGLGVRLLERAQ